MKWTAQTFDRALSLLRSGKTPDAIAQELGVAKAVVTYRLKPYLKRKRVRY